MTSPRERPDEVTRRGLYEIRIRRPQPLPGLVDKAIYRLPGWLLHRLPVSDLPSATLRVRCGWRTVHHERAYGWEIASAESGERLPSDLTGDGVPDLAVVSYSGGAHCCSTLTIFSCGDAFELLAQIELEHSGASIGDLDGDQIPEIRMNDWTFQYWPGSFASSPAPEVILRWSGSRYVVAVDLMRAARPTNEEVDAAIKNALARPLEDRAAAGETFHTVLGWLYSGNGAAAERLLQDVFGRTAAGSELLDEFSTLLKASPYWQQMNQTLDSERFPIGSSARPVPSG